jgi:hypothetical protein
LVWLRSEKSEHHFSFPSRVGLVFAAGEEVETNSTIIFASSALVMKCLSSRAISLSEVLSLSTVALAWSAFLSSVSDDDIELFAGGVQQSLS